MQASGDRKPEFVPPHNYDAEAAVLGSILIDKEAILRVADMVTPEDFYRESHGAIFDAMLGLYAKSEPIDLISLSDRLNEAGQLERCGGQTYLAQLAEAVPTASHVFHYAKIVQRDSTLRRLITASHEIARMGFDGGETDNVESLLDQAEQRLFGVSQKHLKQNFVPIRSVLDEAFDRIDEIHKEKGKLRGVPSGYKSLDNILGGLQASDLIILAARPACGKTAFALDIARNVAVRAQKPVGIFSLEMSKEQLVDRMICAEANVDLWKMRTGRLSDKPGDDDFPRIAHALGTLSEAPIFIDDSANVNIMEIRTKVRRLQKQHGQLGLIVIDYLQLMESQTKIENRVQEIAGITRSLKGLAREMNVPVLALSQLSRAVELTKPAVPKLAHLRESGSIEQDADVVLFIYRKAADRNYRLEDLAPEERHVAEIHIAKHRNGPTGVARLFFDENRTSFKNLDKDFAAPTTIEA
jgi:replicative DNA helicase